VPVRECHRAARAAAAVWRQHFKIRAAGKRPSTFRVVKDGQEVPPTELPVQKAAVSGQEVRESEITVVFDDGTAREMLGNAAPLLDREGKVRTS
jgi:hypothetical protein